jgi:hypothetical protein
MLETASKHVLSRTHLIVRSLLAVHNSHGLFARCLHQQLNIPLYAYAELTINAYPANLRIRILPTNHPPPPHPLLGILTHIHVTQSAEGIHGPDLLPGGRHVKVVDECVGVREGVD